MSTKPESGPYPLRLFELMQKGRLILLRLGNTGSAKPTNGKNWLILSGHIKHITGTASKLYVVDASGHHIYTIDDSHNVLGISSGTASGNYPLFNSGADVQTGQWCPIMLSDEHYLIYGSGSGGLIRLEILEW